MNAELTKFLTNNFVFSNEVSAPKSWGNTVPYPLYLTALNYRFAQPNLLIGDILFCAREFYALEAIEILAQNKPTEREPYGLIPFKKSHEKWEADFRWYKAGLYLVLLLPSMITSLKQLLENFGIVIRDVTTASMDICKMKLILIAEMTYLRILGFSTRMKFLNMENFCLTLFGLLGIVGMVVQSGRTLQKLGNYIRKCLMQCLLTIA